MYGRVLSFLIRHFSNYCTLHRSDLAARAAPLDPRFDPLIVRIFTVFGHSLLEERVLHKEVWVTKLLGIHLSIQSHEKVKFLK